MLTHYRNRIGQLCTVAAHVESLRSRRVYLLGWQFGPTLLVIGGSAESALDEFDERYGTRVDPVADAATLADYDGTDVAERIEHALHCGDIRVNDGGTMVWVDPYEWMRELPNAAAAIAMLRGD